MLCVVPDYIALVLDAYLEHWYWWMKVLLDMLIRVDLCSVDETVCLPLKIVTC